MIAHSSNESYGDSFIEYYDLMYAGMPDSDTLPEFCRAINPGAANVLEFGIGTGRLALPMARAGFSVSGIELSQAMLDVLLERSKGLPIHARRGDFREEVFETKFDIVLILTNTLFMASGQSDQAKVLRQAASRLNPGGLLVVEVYDPYLYLERESPSSLTAPLGESILLTDSVVVDRLSQMVTLARSFISPGRVQSMIEYSYWLTPRELDLLAESVGLGLRCRYSDFEKRPISAETRNVVSVYERAPL